MKFVVEPFTVNEGEREIVRGKVLYSRKLGDFGHRSVFVFDVAGDGEHIGVQDCAAAASGL